MVSRKIERGMTTIQVSISTKEELMKMGRKGETYDDVIRQLIGSAKKR